MDVQVGALGQAQRHAEQGGALDEVAVGQEAVGCEARVGLAGVAAARGGGGEDAGGVAAAQGDDDAVGRRLERRRARPPPRVEAHDPLARQQPRPRRLVRCPVEAGGVAGAVAGDVTGGVVVVVEDDVTQLRVDGVAGRRHVPTAVLAKPPAQQPRAQRGCLC